MKSVFYPQNPSNLFNLNKLQQLFLVGAVFLCVYFFRLKGVFIFKFVVETNNHL